MRDLNKKRPSIKRFGYLLGHLSIQTKGSQTYKREPLHSSKTKQQFKHGSKHIIKQNISKKKNVNILETLIIYLKNPNTNT